MAKSSGGFRRMLVLTTRGVREVAIPARRERSDVAAHMGAATHFLRTGDASRLARFEGQHVEGHELETDPYRIEEWWRGGEFDFLDIYSG